MLGFNFQKYLINKSLSQDDEDGFTLAELIVASAMAFTLLGAAYFFLNSSMRMNKISKRNMEMNANLQETLTEITDEIRSGTLLITDLEEYRSLCKAPINGELLLAIQFPAQALRASDYKPNNDKAPSLDTSFGCPISYILKPNPDPDIQDHTLYRYGPPINEKGYYTNQAYITKPILYGVKSSPIKKIDCEVNTFLKQIKGIQLCIGEFGKYAEISISTEINQPGSGKSQAYISSSAFSRINDFNFADQISRVRNSKSSGACATKDACDFLGQPIISNGVTFAIATNSSLYPLTFGGLSYLDFIKAELIKTVENLSDGETLQIITLEGRERFGEGIQQLWSTPKKLNLDTRRYALNWISNLKLGRGIGYKTAMHNLAKVVEDQSIGQLFVVSGPGLPNYANCRFDIRNNPAGETQQLGSCYKKYNQEIRANAEEGKIRIDTISIGGNWCRETNWGGELAVNMGGKCTVIE